MGQTVAKKSAADRFALPGQTAELPLSVRPFHQERYIQFPKSVTQTFFQLLLSNRKNSDSAIDCCCFRGRKNANASRG